MSLAANIASEGEGRPRRKTCSCKFGSQLWLMKREMLPLWRPSMKVKRHSSESPTQFLFFPKMTCNKFAYGEEIIVFCWVLAGQPSFCFFPGKNFANIFHHKMACSDFLSCKYAKTFARTFRNLRKESPIPNKSVKIHF